MICLDSSAGHGDPRIAELIASRGHVLVLHGGGTTDKENINFVNEDDTEFEDLFSLD